MAKTIQLEGQTITAIRVTWGSDYYTKKARWHLRVSIEGQDTPEEDANCPVCKMEHDATDEAIKSNVKMWIFDVDGLSNDDQNTLTSMIEVQR